MKKIVLLFFLRVCILPVFGQDDFQFDKGVGKVVIPFKFINNLIFIPVKVNGVELYFLLDSGVNETILFSMEDEKEVSLNNVEKITLKGLGGEESIEGLMSTNNNLEFKGLRSTNHLFYIVLDQKFNLSSLVGIPVNGILGYSFLKSHWVEINYERKRIVVYNENYKKKKRIEKKYQRVPIYIEEYKPYVKTSVVLDSSEVPAKLLIDIGNSDAVWLFENPEKAINIPAKNFDDYLGKGFSGDIEGKRAQIKKFSFSKFEFKNPIAAFPDTASVRNFRMVENRSGSVGSEILKRFNVVFDYSSNQMFLRKSNDFYNTFSYNKCGIEVQHSGTKWVKESFSLITVPVTGEEGLFIEGEKDGVANFKYKISLKSVYKISNVRENSAAAKSGLRKADVIVSINNTSGEHFTLDEINMLLKSEEGKWITFEVERDNQILKFKFQLLNELE